MKKLITSLLPALLLQFLFITAAHAQFSDIQATSPQKDSLSFMYRHGIIDGYADGTFKPLAKINRAELLKMIMDASNIQLHTAQTDCFPDVAKGQWYAKYVCTAKMKGWVEGYSDNTFKPQQNVTKAEALKIIANTQAWYNSGVCWTDSATSFTDIQKCSWYYNYVIDAEAQLFIDMNTHFSPAKEITRGEVAEIMFRTILAKQVSPLSRAPEPGYNNTLDGVARDFFTIESTVLKSTYENALTEFKKAADSIDNSRTTLFITQNGETIATYRVSLNGFLESDDCPWTCRTVNVIAKFNKDKQLVAFNWLATSPGKFYSDSWSIISAENDTVTVEIWRNGPDASIPASKQGRLTFMLENLRN